MERDGDKVTLTEREAGNIPRKPHQVRWVLAISLTLAIIAMSLVWIIPALS